MCTVTYLPTSRGFVLTHNRDEAPARSPLGLSRLQVATDKLLAPLDTKAGGTWIASAKSGKLACLLNGAFEKHRHEPPYRRSRGLVLLDFFGFPNPDDFFEHYDFNGIEPFTFLFFAESIVVELRWDGATRFVKKLPAENPHFWCSSTLYPADMRKRREQVFQNWLEKEKKGGATFAQDPKLAAAARLLHETGSVGDPENNFVMNRQDRVQTVSITQVIFRREQGFRMIYQDLQNNTTTLRSLRASTSGKFNS